MRLFEADLAVAKLQAEGIDAVLHDQRIALTHPFVFPDVPLMVPENQVAEAREVLARPASAVAEDEVGDDTARDAADDEYLDEPWRCPRCRQKTVELVPMSPTRRVLVGSWLLLLALPLARVILKQLTGVEIAVGLNPIALTFLWVVVVGILSLVLIFSPRQRRCTKCNHVWKRGID